MLMGVYLSHLIPRGYATASEGLNPRARDIIHLQSPGSVQIGVSWPSGLAYRTQVLVLAAECGFESRP